MTEECEEAVYLKYWGIITIYLELYSLQSIVRRHFQANKTELLKKKKKNRKVIPEERHDFLKNWWAKEIVSML